MAVANGKFKNTSIANNIKENLYISFQFPFLLYEQKDTFSTFYDDFNCK